MTIHVKNLPCDISVEVGMVVEHAKKQADVPVSDKLTNVIYDTVNQVVKLTDINFEM